MSLMPFRSLSQIARSSLAVAGLVLLAGACQSAESKRMKEIAGTYVREYETDPATDPSGMRVHERHALTLRPDGTWTRTHLAEVNGEVTPVPDETGSYRVDGVMVAIGATENGPAQQYTISGDTLFPRTSLAEAQTKAVTSMDMPTGPGPSFLLRQR